jgi:hypothetical protein
MGKFTLFIAFNADNHRLQNAAFATVDRHNGAARRGGEHHAGIFLSSKSACPLMTRSPSCTSIEGRIPSNRRPKWRHDGHLRLSKRAALARLQSADQVLF